MYNGYILGVLDEDFAKTTLNTLYRQRVIKPIIFCSSSYYQNGGCCHFRSFCYAEEGARNGKLPRCPT